MESWIKVRREGNGSGRKKYNLTWNATHGIIEKMKEVYGFYEEEELLYA